MSEPKKHPLRRRGRGASGSSAAPAAPVVDEELTRLAAEALPEAERRRWERQQRAAASSAGASGSTALRSPEDDAEELAEEISRSASRGDQLTEPTPVWYRVIMFGLIVIGLAWLILWYLLDFSYPVPGIGYWNVGIGIGLMMIGLLMTTRWR